MGLREIQAQRYNALATEHRQVLPWTRWLELSLFVNGCFSGIGCGALAMIATPYQLPTILLIAAGLQTGNVLASSYVLRAFSLFSLPLFLFTLASCLILGFRDDFSLLVTAALLVSSWIFTTLCAKRFGHHYRASVGYGLDNLDLVESMQTKNTEIEALNLSLQARVSELKAAQQALMVEKQRSEEAAQAKANFLATMSHEIRTPMNGVLGMAQLHCDSHLDTEQNSYVETILTSGNTLLAIINDVLDLSEVEAGSLTIDPQPANLRTMIEEVGGLLAATPAAANVTLDIAYDATLPEQLVFDDTRLRQVLMNLLGNALKFTDRGNVLVEVSGHVEGSDAELCLDVSDTGIGIPEDRLKHVAEQFSQAEASTTRRFGGTGLGLSICEALIGAMAGTIEVSSVFGEGSRFRVRLSLPAAASEDRPAVRASSDSSGDIYAVTEDQWLLRSICCHAERQGLTAHHLANHEQVKSSLSAVPTSPRALLLDQKVLAAQPELLGTIQSLGNPVL